MFKMIASTLLGVLIGSVSAFSAENCSQPYSSKLSDQEVIALEQKLIQNRLAGLNRTVAFGNCVEKVKDIKNPNAKRSKKGEFSLIETIEGIETVSAYACEATYADRVKIATFKVARFEATGDPTRDSFYTHTGCDEYKASDLNPVTVTVSFLSKP